MTEAAIVVLERDLFFAAKIRETLKAVRQTCVVLKSAEALQARLAETPPPSIVLVHFGVTDLDWQAAIQCAHAAAIPVLAYGSHVDIAAQTEARAAGATRVIPNSKLAADVPGQIERTLARGTTSVNVDDIDGADDDGGAD